MKFLFAALFLIVAIAPVASFAQWTIDGVPLTVMAGDRFNVYTVSDAAGGVIVAWTDARVFNNDVYVQRVSPAGVPLWTANGVPVCTAANEQSLTGIASDGSGGVILTWQDLRSGGYDIYAQRVNSAGGVQWAANGVVVCSIANAQLTPRAVSDGSGGAVIAWNDLRSGTTYDIYAQRVNASGVMQWTANGVALCTASGDQDQHQITAVSGGATVVWRDLRFGGADPDIYAQKVNLAGVPQWVGNGAAVCGVVGIQEKPQLTSDGLGGIDVGWADLRSGNYDIFAQRLDTAGNPLWSGGGLFVCYLFGDQANPVVVSDGAGGMVLTWMDFRSGLTYDTYAQRISLQGAPLWTQNGVLLSLAASSQYNAAIASDGAGGFIFCFQDDRTGPFFEDLYAQRVNGVGITQWGHEGVPVSRASGLQAPPIVCADGAGGTFVAWADGRSGVSEIFVNRVDNVYGFQGHAEPIITSVADVKHDQGGKVAVNWTSSSGDIASPRTIDFYSVWRAVNTVPTLSAVLSPADLQAIDPQSTAPVYLATPGYYFERVGTQSAHGWPGYSFSADTRADSIAAAINNEVFMVAAHYVYDSYVALTSNTVFGHSVDNLAPLAPILLTAQRVGGDVHLKWNGVHIEDLRDYSLYRKTSSGVTPIPMNFLSNADDTIAVDASAPTSALYYIVTAYDVHANQSPPSNEASVSSLTAVGDTPALTELRVLPNHPNPFSASTEFEVGLPSASDISIEVYDVAGRRVDELVVRGAAAGWRKIPFTPRDGHALASGVYFYKVRAAGATIVRKMVVTK